MNKDKRNNIQLLGTLNNADESGIIANANQIYDANEDKSTQDVSKEHTERIKTLEDKENELIAAVGTGGSVDTRITNAVTAEQTRAEGVESTLDGKITAEQTRAANAENALDGRVDTLEGAVGTGGSVDSRIASAVDEVHIKSNYNDGDNIIDFNTIHIITDNPEFVYVVVDVNEKILYGIKTDGQPYFGVGCPQQVKDYKFHNYE